MACLRIGLTGGIGSGKSTVAAMLADLGASIVDADAISRQLTAPGGAAIDAIRTHFGADFIDSSGAMNREAMRALAFRDPGARAYLQSMIHPLVHQTIATHTQLAIHQGARCVVLDIPLLVESGSWPAKLDQVWVVDCEPSVQIERVKQRSGLADSEVRAIIAAQAQRPQRLAVADVVIFNNASSLPSLQQDVFSAARSLGL